MRMLEKYKNDVLFTFPSSTMRAHRDEERADGAHPRLDTLPL